VSRNPAKTPSEKGCFNDGLTGRPFRRWRSSPPAAKSARFVSALQREVKATRRKIAAHVGI
jgi:hypothetical protein